MKPRFLAFVLFAPLLGVGLQGRFVGFDERLHLDLVALYGSTGSASATFSGAAVSGPASLATYKAKLAADSQSNSVGLDVSLMYAF